ncbi:MAG: adenylate/guanylate cyclase domain-containing protein [Actinomycetota bacterium]
MRSKTAKVDVGAAAFVFTDVVSSTQLLESLGDDHADRLRRLHFRVLRSTVAPFRGREVKSLGDGLMVVFRSSVDALRCAVAMQRAIDRHNERHPSGALQIRIGVHVGESVEEEGDYFGTPVVVAKRLCDKAGGGQILISGTIRSLVGSRGNLLYRDCGTIELKGITQPMPAHEVLWQPVDGAETDVEETEAEPALAKPSRRLGTSLVVLGLAFGAVIGAVVVLSSRDVLDGGSSSRPSTVTSPLSWVRVHDNDLGGPGTQKIKRVIAVDEGFIGVGRDTAAGDHDAAVWSARADGLDWTRNTDPDNALGGPGSQEVWDVEAREGTGLVAVGTDDPGNDLDAAAWISRDGVEWSRVEHDEAVFGGSQNQVLQRVTATATGFVAVGSDSSGGDHDAAVWFTSDGVSWVREGLEQQTLGGDADQQMRDAVSLEDGRVVAVGYDGLKGDYDAAAWVGRDSRWRRVAIPTEVAGGPGDQIMTSVTAFDGGLVISGREVQGGSDGVIWYVTENGEWNRVARDHAFSGPGDQTIWGVTNSPIGLLASGNDSQGGGFDAVLWRSLDGRRWERVPRDEGVFGGDAGQEMRWVASSPTRAVAVGSDSSSGSVDAAVWVASLEPDAE